MPAVDWSQCPVVERVPGRCSGAVTFKNSRSMLATVFANIGYMSIDELVVQYRIPREYIEEVMGFLEQSCEPEPSL
jgi:uncharacterized protein (DUF433 family)